MEQKQIKLSAAQQRQLLRLVSALGQAQQAVKHANEVEQAAQTNANDFLGYCAEEAGITLGTSAWTFDQAQMAFVQAQGDRVDTSSASIETKLPQLEKTAERNGAR